MSSFNDEFASEKRSALDETSYEFPWSELYEAFGESEEPERDYEQFIAAMNVVFTWLLDGRIGKGYDTSSGRKLIALAWVLRPEQFGGKSIAQMARILGVSPVALQIRTGEVSRRFKVRNRSQQHAGNWQKEIKDAA